ncbi:hypothetical protein CDAR_93171 [Caerostris darwini]|uniref:Uncharacterized protein n=1 Tax=Caerostris darwini TaxID=1538125 RepID=A0AAV4X3E2_9ARAC|nr:hypothetical protein CDAR_93171 [Caerostris darwini]
MKARTTIDAVFSTHSVEHVACLIVVFSVSTCLYGTIPRGEKNKEISLRPSPQNWVRSWAGMWARSMEFCPGRVFDWEEDDDGYQCRCPVDGRVT